MENNTLGQIDPLMDHDNTLFDYDAGLDRTLQETTSDPKKSEASSAPILGVDEKVKISKQRRHTVKLDENRLLSHSGIPKLRLAVKHRLRFKGKGHEFSDTARLLNFYQLWLDDLFPRAKFADGLSIIEKLGHSKRLQTMRRDWIEEEKPGRIAEDMAKTGSLSHSLSEGLGMPIENNDDTDVVLVPRTVAQTPVVCDSKQSPPMKRSVSSQNLSITHEEPIPLEMIHEGIPDDDDLDALLREHEDGNNTLEEPGLTPRVINSMDDSEV
ncbi:Swi3-domain-containing protein [Aspergillus ellipticus CBS 707.79]|uniref:Chromosome segregation in meiosis protein n=1 Tax=Aspergillus ellipticus CBS 707.79 TaxID=1448320 RepID=A0A319DJS8_9EURO|nr:Swi3-domain-containing protein [Aspergillus ellipticus CBS 707.79]